MPRRGDTVHIPLPEQDAIAGLLKVKPTKDMPRPGANPTGKKKTKKRPTQSSRRESPAREQ